MPDYRVTCACGRVLTGRRRAAPQSVNCPACGRPAFVLPPGAWGEAADKPSRSAWRGPLLAGAAASAVAIAGFVALVPLLRRPAAPVGGTAVVPAAGEAIRERERVGRQALADGRFHLARRLFGEAVAERDRDPDLLTPAGHRALNQLHRQADLLARLCPLPLAEVVRRAAAVRDRAERDADFDFHFRGKTVLFDDEVAEDPRGRPVARVHELRPDGESVRPAFEDLELFAGRRFDPPQRLLFGARLAGCEPGEGGGWVVRFEPASAVLLTDAGAARALLPAPFAREPSKYEEVLRRQQAWVDRLAGLKPAAP